MRIITYNIHYGVGHDGCSDLQRIVRVIRGADLIALQEVDRYWSRSGNCDQLGLLQEAFPGYYSAWGPNIDILKVTGEHTPDASTPRRQFGNLILSRYPILSIRNHLLPRYAAAVYLDIQRGALEALIDAPGGLLTVYCTHLCHLSDAQRARQTKHLLAIVSRAYAEGSVLSGSHPGDPSWTSEPAPPAAPSAAIVLGDFNSTPDSRVYALMAGEIGPRQKRLTRRGGFFDAWELAGRCTIDRHDSSPARGATRFDSFPPRGLGQRVDYCFVREGLERRVLDACVIANSAGSDHLPLAVTLADS